MGTQEHWTAAQYQEYLRLRAKGGNKYHAVKAQADGRTYDSRSECKRAKELQQTAAKVQELIGKITTKDPATGAKLSAAVIQVLQSTARNLEVAQ